MDPRARSESPLVGDLRPNHFNGLEPLPLFNANNARRRAEQDSILLHNRIRLLRMEEEKAKKKIRETESKTREIVTLRQRGEEKRLARDAESARREALEQELQRRAAGVREEQHRKVQMAQREILEQRNHASHALKNEKEIHKQQIQQEQEEAAAEAYARAQQVRRELVASERKRARSEGAKLDIGRANFQEKLAREEDARRANQQQIGRMEKEEAELIGRLQRSQDRHRAAFAQLEDALAGGNPLPLMSGSSGVQSQSSSSRCLDMVPLHELPHGATASTGSRTPLAASSYANSADPEPSFPRASRHLPPTSDPRASRPPRPRPTPLPELTAGSSGSTGPGRSRPTSASRAASVPRMPASSASGAAKLHNGCRTSKSVTALRENNSSTSICSTASGGPGNGADSAASSGHCTPSSAAAAAIVYTTVDGLQLEVAEEEDLDLGKLLGC